MKKSLKCLRCGGEMETVRRDQIQLGKTGWVTGDLGNLLSGALDVIIVSCPKCGKLEFFSASAVEPETVGSGIAQVKCPQCGRSYEMDDPKCPFCGQKNTTLF